MCLLFSLETFSSSSGICMHRFMWPLHFLICPVFMKLFLCALKILCAPNCRSKSHIFFSRGQLKNKLSIWEPIHSRCWERSGGRDRQVELIQQSVASLASPRTFRRAPHPPKVVHGQCSFSAELCSKSWQEGVCEPALLNCSFRRLTAFWAGSQVTHWVLVQPVWASVSSSVQQQRWTL